MNLFDLTGKKAIVVGAAKETGLCFAMAKGLSMAGADIVIADVSDRLDKTIEMAGGAKAGFYGVRMNLLDIDDMERGFRDALDITGGRVDILLNGGGLQHREPAIDFAWDQWEKIMQVNLGAVFRMCQLAGKVMIAQGQGKIINVASVNAFLGGNIIPAYSCSKGGVVQLTRALSNEWISLGVNVNAIVPGFMETEFTLGLRQMAQVNEITPRIPAGKWGKPTDLQGAAIFLASAASNYVSGTTLAVDGGYLGH